MHHLFHSGKKRGQIGRHPALFQIACRLADDLAKSLILIPLSFWRHFYEFSRVSRCRSRLLSILHIKPSENASKWTETLQICCGSFFQVKLLFSSFSLSWSSEPDQNIRLPNEFIEFDSLFIQFRLTYYSGQLCFDQF
jgi:hypothetical protein